MAQITPAIRRAHGLAGDLVPVEIRKAISQEELLDRLTYAAALVKKAQATTASPAERKGYAAQAQAVIRAQPRAVTERQVAERITKAAGLGNTGQADALRRAALELLALHAPAPRREDAAAVTVAKAQAGGDTMVVLYDETGRAFGVCRPEAIQPVVPHADVAKSLGKARAPVRRPGRR